MPYFFPNLLSANRVPDRIDSRLRYTFGSGEIALRFLLRSRNLPRGTRVAIPAFVCEAVGRAVVKEGLVPHALDLLGEDTFHSDYSSAGLQGAGAVVLVHLYGSLHPQTTQTSAYCRERRIPLIHDAAQSYGIEEAAFGNDPVLYSFGAGKSSEAAFGGWVPTLEESAYRSEVHSPSSLSTFVVDRQAQAFLRSRIFGAYGRSQGGLVRLLSRGGFLRREGFYGMTPFQLRAASEVLRLVPTALEGRRSRYESIAASVRGHPDFVLANPHGASLGFKCVGMVRSDPEVFGRYLIDQGVPFFRLFSAGTGAPARALPRFDRWATAFFEISTEATIPLAEIERVAEVLSNHRAGTAYSKPRSAFSSQQ